MQYETKPNQADLATLGLKGMPFSTQIEADLYFETPSLKQRLDLLLHLGHYSDLVLVITGPAGSGKTSLLRHVVKKSGESIRIIVIEARQTMNQEQLLGQILEKLNVSERHTERDAMLKALQATLEAMERKSLTVVLAIDDAHKLPESGYKAIEQLANIRDEDGKELLHFMLFGEEEIQQQLDNSSLQYRLKKIDLPRLSQKETGQYIRYRLKQTGVADAGTLNSIFTPSTILKIHKQSEGLPENVNQLVDKELGQNKAPQIKPDLKEKSPIITLKVLGAGLLALILILILIFQDRINDLFTSQELTPEKLTQEKLTAEKSSPEKIKPEKKEPTTEPVIPESAQSAQKEPKQITGTDILVEPDETSGMKKKITGAPAEKKEPSTAKPPLPPLTQEESPLPPSALSTPESANAPVTKEQQTKEETAKTEQPAITPPKEKAQEGPSAIKREDWILKQNPEYFTIQLYGATNEAEVLDVIKKYPLPSQVAYFRTFKKGTDWYSLITGIYPDMASANQSVKDLPPKLAKGAWIRRVKWVQDDIGKARPETPHQP
jgi:DamX protein